MPTFGYKAKLCFKGPITGCEMKLTTNIRVSERKGSVAACNEVFSTQVVGFIELA